MRYGGAHAVANARLLVGAAPWLRAPLLVAGHCSSGGRETTPSHHGELPLRCFHESLLGVVFYVFFLFYNLATNLSS